MSSWAEAFPMKVFSHQGFTIIEMLVVVAIVGILGVISIPSILNMRARYELKTAANELDSAFRNARALAIKEKRDVTIAFDESGNFYTFDKGNRERRMPGGAQDATLMSAYSKTLSFGYPGRSSGVSFKNLSSNADAGSTITFNALGLTNSSVAGFVYLHNGKGEGYRVGVQGLACNIVTQKCGQGGVNCLAN